MKRSIYTFAIGLLSGALVGGGITYSVLRNSGIDDKSTTSHTGESSSVAASDREVQSPWNGSSTHRESPLNPQVTDFDSLIAEWQGAASFAVKAGLIEQIIQNCHSPEQWLRVRDLLLSTTAGPQRSDAMHRLVSHVAKLDPKAAIDDLLPSLEGIDKHNAMIEIAIEWSENNPLEALNYARSENAQETRGAITELATFNLAKTSPDVALIELRKLESILTGEELGNTINGLIAGWSSHDPSAAYQFVNGQFNLTADERVDFLETLVGNAALADATKTMSFVENTLKGDEKEAAITTTYKIWSENDPAAAASSASNLAAGELTDTVIETIAREWRNYDSDAANQWLDGLNNVSEEAKKAILENQTAEMDPDFKEFEESFKSDGE